MKKYLKALPLALALIAGAASANTLDLTFNAQNVAKGAFTFDYPGYGIHATGGDDATDFRFQLQEDSNVTFLGKYFEFDHSPSGQIDAGYNDGAGFFTMLQGTTTSYTRYLAAGSYNLWMFPQDGSHKGFGSFILTAQPVPEPETYALMGLGLVGLLAARRRKQAK